MVFGILGKDDENVDCVIKNFITKDLEVPLEDVHLEEVKRIGKRFSGYHRPILIQIRFFKEKKLLLTNAKNLKGTNIAL